MSAQTLDGEEVTLACAETRDLAPCVTLADTHNRDPVSDHTCPYDLNSPGSDSHSAQSRIPNELWCMIWACLPLASIVDVSHVCRDWRFLSIGCPRLWCHLRFWTYVAAAGCLCDECDATGSDESSSTTTGPSNLRVITEILPRSHSLPLKLTIRVYHLYADHSVIEALAAALADHSSRIASLSFTSDDVDAPLVFFPRFSSLPALEHLAVRCPEDLDDGGRALTHGENSKLHLPVLRCLEISAGIGSDPLDTTLLKTLAAPYVSANSLLPLVLAAPSLEMLNLRIPDCTPRFNPAEDFARLSDISRRIGRIVISNIAPDSSDYASRLCTLEHPEFTMIHAPWSEYATMHVLSTVEHPAWLRIRTHMAAETGTNGVLLTVDDASHKRSLWVPRSALESTWPGYTPQHFPPRAAVDVALLALVPRDVSGALTGLVVIMPFVATPAPGGIPSFPALETLEFRLKGKPGPRSRGYMFFQIVFMLRHGAQRKLRTLTFTGFPEHLQSEAFSPFAESISIDPPRQGA